MTKYKHNDLIINGKYRIEKLLGEGSFGEVYLANHQHLNSLRALKILRKDQDGAVPSINFGDYRKRFLQESKLGARLNAHPNIIQVMDFDEQDDELVLALEYAPGGSLYDVLEKCRDDNTQMDIKKIVEIGIGISKGLSVLHKLDVVHRDLKPSNILFGRDGLTKIADFGLAQIAHGASMRSQLSQPEPHPGTPIYMSPEQEKTTSYLGCTSDIYSFGVVLFEMLTLRIFSRKTLRPGTRAITLRSDTPVWLDDLIMRMLSENAEDRPWDGEEAGELLEKGGLKKSIESDKKIVLASDETFMQPTDKPVSIELDQATQNEEKKPVEILQEPELPSANPDGTRTWKVSQNGLGFCRQISEAIKLAKDGDLIEIYPGQYNENLTLEKDIKLVGVGKNSEIVVFSHSDFVIGTAAKACSIRNILIENLAEIDYENENRKKLYGGIYIQKGVLEIDNCIIKGNRCVVIDASAFCHMRNLLVKDGYSGISFIDNSRGSIENCIIQTMDTFGIHIGKMTKVQVLKSVVSKNLLHGIVVEGECLIQENEIRDNKEYGLYIGKEINPTVISNRIIDNSLGIGLEDKSKGVIEKNSITDNEFGIILEKECNPFIRGNTIDARKDGICILVSDHSEGLIENNEIIGDENRAGIYVEKGSNPTIRSNRIRAGLGAGVRITENSKSIIDNNDIFGNKVVGIDVRESSNPKISKNKIHGNGVGIAIQEESHGSFKENDIYQNTSAGIDISSNANPAVFQNIIHEEDCGIKFRENALGGLFKNTINRCVLGIGIDSKSKPLILSNQITDCNNIGLSILNEAKPLIERNEILNVGTGVYIIKNGYPIVVKNTIGKNKDLGIFITQNGRGVFLSNRLYENGLANVIIKQDGSEGITNLNSDDPSAKKQKSPLEEYSPPVFSVIDKFNLDPKAGIKGVVFAVKVTKGVIKLGDVFKIDGIPNSMIWIRELEVKHQFVPYATKDDFVGALLEGKEIELLKPGMNLVYIENKIQDLYRESMN